MKFFRMMGDVGVYEEEEVGESMEKINLWREAVKLLSCRKFSFAYHSGGY